MMHKRLGCRVYIFAAIFALAIVRSGFSVPAYAQEEIPSALQKKLDEKITLDLRDMNVIDVYKFLAVKGDFNIAISKSVTGRVTLILETVSIKDALDIVSFSNNLAYKIMGDNIVHVMSDAEYSEMFGKRFNDKTILKIIYLAYAKPSYVLEALKNIKSDIGRIVIDEETGSVVMIDTDESVKKMIDTIMKMDHPLETKVYDLKYAKAEDAANQLRNRIDNQAVGTVQADARSNRLIVRAFPERMKEVEQLIEALDKKTQAVRIEVRILKLILNPKFDMGFSWQSRSEDSPGTEISALDLLGAFPISSSVSTAASLGTVGRILIGDASQDDFTGELKMLKQISETKVLANPSIMVVNNQEARIHIGDKLAYVTTTTIGTGESQKVNEEIHYIDVGVKFIVTPTINDEGFISMKIQPEISSKSGELETPQGAKVPLLNSTLVDTTVLVKDGNTIIIGGLRQDEVTKSKKGIPYLMDIPFLGKMFSNVSDSKTQTEIVILLTPHIVTGEENVVDTGMVPATGIRPDKTY